MDGEWARLRQVVEAGPVTVRIAVSGASNVTVAHRPLFGVAVERVAWANGSSLARRRSDPEAGQLPALSAGRSSDDDFPLDSQP